MTTTTLDIEDFAALTVYLRRHGRIGPDERPQMRNLAGGVSNRTVLLTRANGGESWVLKQALERLRVKTEWLSDPKRIHAEARGIHWLSQLAPPGAIPQLIFEDHEHHLLAMSAVPQPHENWKTMLLAGDVQADHVAQFATLLATIHRRAHERAGEVRPVFADTAFFETLRLEPYYLYTAQQVPETSPFLRDLVERTRQRRITIVHGDYSPKNVLVHEGKLILLDHEVIHWGDPAFDLGFSMTHLLSKAHHLPAHRAKFAQAARDYWHMYQQTLGDVSWRGDLEPTAVSHTLACLLARVAGRSPLEYMSNGERAKQQQAVTDLIGQNIGSIDLLVEQFVRAISG